MRDASLVPSVLIDAAEFARLLSVSKPTIWRMKEARKLPKEIALTSQCVRWRLRTGDAATGVLDWIDAGCVCPEKQNALTTQSPERSKLDCRASLPSEVTT